ncbi:MAG TPA: hopanoid biosynthesis-associated protein HpnK [Candidatus Tyrphobacter sp.]
MKRLVVTADDFGASLEINEAVERAHREGMLTAASLMVGESAFDDAVERARRMPKLGVGLHVSLVNARPVLPKEQVPDLVDARGNFDDNLVRAGVRYFFLPRVRKQLEAEIRAQFEAYAATGLALDHVDGHNHLQVHPTLFSIIMRIGRDYGMRAMRVPWEPSGIVNALLIRPWAALMRTRLHRAGIRSNDALFGLKDTGRLSEARVLEILSALPEGLNELYLHPRAGAGIHGNDTAGYAREEELDTLLSPRVRDAISAHGIRPVRYGDSFA